LFTCVLSVTDKVAKGERNMHRVTQELEDFSRLLFGFALPLNFLGSATNAILDVGLFLAGEDFRFNHHHFSKSWVLDRQPRSSGSACEPPGGKSLHGKNTSISCRVQSEFVPGQRN